MSSCLALHSPYPVVKLLPALPRFQQMNSQWLLLHYSCNAFCISYSVHIPPQHLHSSTQSYLMVMVHPPQWHQFLPHNEIRRSSGQEKFSGRGGMARAGVTVCIAALCYQSEEEVRTAWRARLQGGSLSVRQCGEKSPN